MAIDDVPLTYDPLAEFELLELRQVTPGYVGEAADCASAVTEALAAARRLADISTQLSDHELTETARSLALVMQQAEATLVAVTTDAIDRGAVASSTAADASQWLGRLSRNEPLGELVGGQTASNAGPLVPIQPDADVMDVDAANEDTTLRAGLEPTHCARLAKLAQACRSPQNALILDSVVTGRVNTTIAKVALDATGPISAVLPKTDRDKILSVLLDLEPGSGASAVRELSRRIIAFFSEDDEPDVEEDTLQRQESLNWSNLPTGLVRLIADLSPDNAEMVKHAIQSMSAPAPASECCDNVHHRHHDKSGSDPSDCETDQPDSDAWGSADTDADAWAGTAFGARPGDPDLRAPGKRRADAFTELMRLAARAADADSDVKTSGIARIIVTIDHDRLAGNLTGLGYSQSGVGITPDTVRQLACDAEIIPMVLGSRGEPLNVGRKKRLVDKELRAAVIQRDRHCTFEGCSRPPVMCEVHHVKHWAHGGETSLRNSALLCSTHHRIVHREGLTATVTDAAVTWLPASARFVATA